MRLKLYRGVWCAVWRDATGTKRKSFHTTDRSVAEQRMANERLLPAIAGGELTTVGAIFQAYHDDKGSERTGWAWKRLAPTFAVLRPDQVTRAACRGYIAMRRNPPGGLPASDGTIHTELTYLRAALRWHNPRTPSVIELPSKPGPRDSTLTRDQFDLLLSKATLPHLRLFIVLALTTAGRASAILELTWDRVDFERGLIHLGDGSKRRKGRATVPMNPRSRAALLTAHAVRSCPFVVEYNSARVLRIVKGFRSIAGAAGMPWCTPHVMRHTAAVWMAESGVPMPQIAQVLGHSDSRITERVYARYSPDYLRAAIGSL